MKWTKTAKAVARTLSSIPAALCICAALRAAADTPDAYLEYVEATGSQYVDTGVNAETGLKARIDISWVNLASTDDCGILGARKDSGNTRFYMLHLNKKTVYGNYKTWSASTWTTGLTAENGKRYEFVSDFTDSSALQVYLKGAKTFGDTGKDGGGTLDTGCNLYLFAVNYNGTADVLGHGKLYGLKIFKKNDSTGELELIRHYLPCLKDGHAGLYDKVNGTISFSQGANHFVAGPELPRPVDMVEWIQSDGSVTNVIDTWVYGKSGLKSDLDFMIASGSGGDAGVLGARAAGSGANRMDRLYLAYYYNGKFCLGYTNYYSSAISTANRSRYSVYSDLSDGSQSLTVNGSVFNNTSTGYYCTTNTLFLFGLHTGDTTNNCSTVRLYSAKIWDGNELLRDFAPCVDSDGKAGLYDKVSERVFKSLAAYDLDTQVGVCTNAVDTLTFITGDSLTSTTILSTNESAKTVVFRRTRLDDYEPAYAYFSNTGSYDGEKWYVNPEINNEILRPYNVVRSGSGDGATMTVQFQGVTRTHVMPHTASVTVKFVQNDANVEAYVTNAVALKPLDIELGLDLDAMVASGDERAERRPVAGNGRDSLYNVSVIVLRKPRDAAPRVVSPFEASDSLSETIEGNVPVIVRSSDKFSTDGFFPDGKTVSGDWTIVAENRNLEDLVEVSGNYHYAANKDEKQFAYNLIDSTFRTGQKTCQFQYDHGDLISCLLVQFRQNGANIEAYTGSYRTYYVYYRNTASYTGAIDSSLALGKNFEDYNLDDTSEVLHKHGYYATDDSSSYRGVKNLTLRFGTASHAQVVKEGYLPWDGWTPDDKMEWVVVARNRDLADLEEVQGYYHFSEQNEIWDEWQTAYNLKYTSLSNLIVFSYAEDRDNNWVNNATNMMLKTCQFQHDGYNSSGQPRISCVHVLFRQEGADILAGIGKYRTYNMLKTQNGVTYDEIRLGMDFENYTRLTTPSWVMFGKLATSDSSTAHGVKDLRLKFRMHTSSVNTGYMPDGIDGATTNWTVVAENRALSNLVSTAAIFHRTYGESETQVEVGTSGLFLKFGDDYQTASCQFQIRPRWNSHNYVECIRVLFRQNGDNIEAVTGNENAWFSSTKYGIHEISTSETFGELSDFDSFSLVVSEGGEAKFTGPGQKCAYNNWGTSYNSGGKGLRDLRLYFSGASSLYAAAHTGGGAPSLDFEGDQDMPLSARTDAATVFPSNGVVTVGPYAELLIGDHVANSRWTQYRVMTNGTLRTVGKYRTEPTDQIDLVGGVLSVREDAESGDSECYLNYVTFMNGAIVRGRHARVLHDSNNASWIVAGDSPAFCECGLVVTGSGNAAQDRTFFFDVNDVTGDGDVDFYVSGPVCDFGSVHGQDGNWNVHVVKDGAGTVNFGGRIQLPNEFIVSNGVVRLGENAMFNCSRHRLGTVDGVADKRVDFHLAGGALEAAEFTTNSVAGNDNHPNALVVKAADSGLVLGDSAYLKFNTLAFDTGATLAVSSSGLERDAVLIVGASLSAAELGNIRWNGHKVRQLRSGRLIPVTGMASIFR